MKRSAGSDDAYLYVSALRELFGLDVEHRAGGARPGAERHRAAPQGPSDTEELPGDLRIATRGSALALAQARQVAELLGGAELVEVSSDGEAGRQGALRARGRAGAARRRGRPRGPLGQGPAGASCRRGSRSRRCRRARTRPTPASAPAARSTRCRRAPGSAPPACAAAPSCSPPGPTCEVERAARQRRHPPAQARRGRARRDRARRRRPAAARPRGARSRFALPARR